MICLHCGQDFTPKGRGSANAFCSRYCWDAHRLDVKPWNALQRRVLAVMERDRLSLAATAKRLEISPSTFKHWFERNYSTMPEARLRRVAELVGVPYDQALSEGGGTTAEARQITVAAKLLPGNAAIERARELGRPIRERRRLTTQEAKAAGEKRRATWERNGSLDRSVAGLRSYTSSIGGRIVHALFGHIRGNPRPTRNEVQLWAEDEAEKPEVQLTPKAVIVHWEPYLAMMQIAGDGKDGKVKQREQRRLSLYTALAPDYPLGPGGGRPNGLLEAFANAVSEAEGKAITISSARDWLWRHGL